MEPNTTEQAWQVDVGGQVYTAAFGELGEWINDGSLLPQDKVRKGNLRWIEAQKVPGLAPFFNAKALGVPMPITVMETVADTQMDSGSGEAREAAPDISAFVTAEIKERINPDHCVLHPEIESFYVCETCCNGFCKGCPRSYGGSVKVCPACGAMCKPIAEARTAAQKAVSASGAIAEGFGIDDFFSALSHPFKYKSSLFFGTLMFGFFTIGQSATGVGGILLFAAALVCLMLANMLTFGVLANTIDNFVHGNLESDFMPKFEDFSIWEDVVHPFFLSIAAYAVSFGPFILTVLIGLYLVVSSTSSQMQAFQSEIERLPGTKYYAGREPVEQSKQVKRVLGDISEDHEDLIAQHNDAATGNVNVAPKTPVDEDLEMWSQLQESRKRELEAAFGKTAETREKESQQMISGLLNLAAPLVILGAIAFLWGVFYFPASCAVAGYTRSFVATVNPIVGLDTIKRLGLNYPKILMMSLGLVSIWLFTGTIFGIIFAPFDLPGMGNVPAKILSSFIVFYLFAVFSCVLGYALVKNAHKLDIVR